MKYCKELQGRLQIARNYQNDNDNARLEMQMKLDKLQASEAEMARENRSMKTRNPYVVVLIDGDGLKFQNTWIEDRNEGGKKAAAALRSWVAREFGRDIEGLEIIVKVVANIEGLEIALKHELGHDTLSKLRAFASGFTQSTRSFDFSDIGFGKERADYKIAELARWHLRNYNCKHVVLVTVLETTPTHRDIRVTGVNIVPADESLFRSDKVEVPHVRSKKDRNNGAASGPSGEKAPQALSPGRATNGGPRNGALEGRQQNTSPRQANSGPQAPKDRKDGKKLCNFHYLAQCNKKGSKCQYLHDHPITEEEKTALTVLARFTSCNFGQNCTNDDCIYGHHCPHTKDGVCFNFNSCKFKVHPPGTGPPF
ncbi:hypothetical protein ESCO_005443 [Escovopsis weberi]|uniref:C3H1-type domain-containing protein n=1 Tax=Escovopsis weberi TaxID=150374 RepID=A0A0M8MVV5_ESCWE|nr:hypothetical protein ESCO_005443 [Escovopsis weberi]